MLYSILTEVTEENYRKFQLIAKNVIFISIQAIFTSFLIDLLI